MASIDDFEKRFPMGKDDRARLRILMEFIPGLYQENPAYAIGLAIRALRLATELRENRAYGEALRYRGLCHRALRDYQAASADFREAYETLKSESVAEIADVAYRLAEVFDVRGDVRQALLWYRRALEHAEQFSDLPLQTKALEAFGTIHTALGDYARALEYHFRCLGIREEMKDGDGMGHTLSAIGIVYGLMHDFDSAFDYFSRSIHAFREVENRLQEVRAMANLGRVHYSRGELEIALEYALRVLAIYQALHDKPDIDTIALRSDIGAILITIGNINEKMGAPDVALAYLLQVYDVLDGTPSDDLRVSALLNLGRLRRATGDDDGARWVFEHALSIAREIGDPHLQYQLHLALSDTYDVLGDLRNALEHQRCYGRIREEVAGREKQKAIATLQVQFDIEKAERERESERKRAVELEEQMQRTRNTLAATLLNLVEKNKLLETLKAQLLELENKSGGDGGKIARDIVREINSNVNSEKDWNAYEHQLNQLAPGFMHRLVQRFPGLSRAELNVCALTRSNLDTKKIAEVLFISPRTVEEHRSNSRKKMGLKPSDNFSSVIEGI